MTKATSKQHLQIAKRSWIEDVEKLIDSVKAWAEERDWHVHIEKKTLNEPSHGSYDLPILFIRTPQLQKLVIDPAGLDVLGAEGRIDIEAFPSLHRFVLLRQDGKWRLMTDSMIEWPERWGKETFFKVIAALQDAA